MIGKLRRVYMQHLKQFDAQDRESHLRHFEMMIDSVVNDPGRIIQFWRDVTTYGLEEAYLFLENDGNDGRFGIDKGRLPDVKKGVDDLCAKVRLWFSR